MHHIKVISLNNMQIKVCYPKAKHDVVLGKHNGKTFFGVSHQVCTHLSWPAPLYRNAFNPLGFRVATWQLKAPYRDLLDVWIDVWRLAACLWGQSALQISRSSRTFDNNYRNNPVLGGKSHFAVFRKPVQAWQRFGWGREVPVQDFMLHGPVYWPLDAVKLSCT